MKIKFLILLLSIVINKPVLAKEDGKEKTTPKDIANKEALMTVGKLGDSDGKKLKKVLVRNKFRNKVTNKYAADGAGNGGAAWVCYEFDRERTIRWARTVDLYEAENEFNQTLYPFKIDQKNYDFPDQAYYDVLDQAATRLYEINRDLYMDTTSDFVEVSTQQAFKRTALSTIGDAITRIKPPKESCYKGEIEYVQVMNFTHYGKILVNDKVFNSDKFSDIDRAALLFHEAIYSYLRRVYGDTDSVRTREIVAFVFSDKPASFVNTRLTEALGIFVNATDDIAFQELRKNNTEDEIIYMEDQVSQILFFEINGYNPSFNSDFADCPADYIRRYSQKSHKSYGICPQLPVENLTKTDIDKFVRNFNTLKDGNYRLPTEAELHTIYAKTKLSTEITTEGDSDLLQVNMWEKSFRIRLIKD